MVQLTITPSMSEGLELYREHLDDDNLPIAEFMAVGCPISHGQIIELWQGLNAEGNTKYTLEYLLRGSKVYIPSPPPKHEPSDEFKALMARLRRDEEQRQYERMTHPPPQAETFSQRYPRAGMTAAFAEVNRPASKADLGDDDVTYEDIHRQLMLILNFAVSIAGVALTLWVLARWWSTPARIFLTMGGSILVGIAEIVVYSGYIWHLGKANKREKKVKEVKEVVGTWVVEKGQKGEQEGGAADNVAGRTDEGSNLRRRKKETAR